MLSESEMKGSGIVLLIRFVASQLMAVPIFVDGESNLLVWLQDLILPQAKVEFSRIRAGFSGAGFSGIN